VVAAPEPVEIGARVRLIRRRRGLSLDVAAGLAGISKPYLSQLETGQRHFNRRGLLDDLATALSCSVVDLTGQPYLPVDRVTADALATLPGIATALYDTTLDDVPDAPARPAAQLADLARKANIAVDESRYDLAGAHLSTALIELHISAVTGDTENRRAALAALTEACIAAAGTARQLGHLELAVQAARRGCEAARAAQDGALAGFAAMDHAGTLTRLGARRQSAAVLAGALAEVEPAAVPSAPSTSAAQARGMLHLGAAQLAAREGRADDAQRAIREAGELAERVGERNTLCFHFGPANVAAWSLAIAVELERGAAAAEKIDRSQWFDMLGSADRRAGLHLDLARGYAQAEGARDAEAIRHLDTADRVAPQRSRLDPIARDLVLALDQRAKRRVWELDSLKNRFGV